MSREDEFMILEFPAKVYLGEQSFAYEDKQEHLMSLKNLTPTSVKLDHLNNLTKVSKMKCMFRTTKKPQQCFSQCKEVWNHVVGENPVSTGVNRYEKLNSCIRQKIYIRMRRVLKKRNMHNDKTEYKRQDIYHSLHFIEKYFHDIKFIRKGQDFDIIPNSQPLDKVPSKEWTSKRLSMYFRDENRYVENDPFLHTITRFRRYGPSNQFEFFCTWYVPEERVYVQTWQKLFELTLNPTYKNYLRNSIGFPVEKCHIMYLDDYCQVNRDKELLGTWRGPVHFVSEKH